MRAFTPRTLRFLRCWLSPGSDIEHREVEIEVQGRGLPATLYLPRGEWSRKTPSWIVLHGVTRPGRSHLELVRFCRAVAASGAVALVPAIPEWSALELAPDRTIPVIRGAADWLDVRGPASPASGRPGLIGFSFGAPQALRAAADRALRERIAGVAGFGGYFDIHRTVRFQLTGRHEWDGGEEILAPDPYGRWIMAANHLTDVPGHESAVDVSRALRTLAAHAGDARIPSDAPEMEEIAAPLRRKIHDERQGLFDLLFRGPALGRPGSGGSESGGPAVAGTAGAGTAGAAVAGTGGEAGEAERTAELETLAVELADAALRVTPELDVSSALPDVACPVELVHGRLDRLIPYTESLRMASGFPPGAPVRITITELFAHSRGRGLGIAWKDVVEGWRFVDVLGRMLALSG